MFTDQDFIFFESKGIDLKTIEKQIDFFRRGAQPVELIKPAIPEQGLEVLSGSRILEYAEYFDKYSADYSKIKFIPASGAASRMFKDLFLAFNDLLSDPYKEKEIISSQKILSDFFRNIENYPFFKDLCAVIKENGTHIKSLLEEEKYSEILFFLLKGPGLNYGVKPKGVLKFHKYEDDSRTPVEEHFIEAKEYLVNKDNSLLIHFTISPEHREMFMKISESLVKSCKGKGIILNIEYSYQEPFTDTIAVDLSGNPIREDNGNIFFRPGGHGALLQNLGKMEEELIFISNIDNCAPDKLKPIRVQYKKFLGGYLMEKIQKIRGLLSDLEKDINQSFRDELILFIQNNISDQLAESVKVLKNKEFRTCVFNILNRPVRVCGMVKNTGEPGGGPFWIRSKDGTVSKQIIESSQIDTTNEEQVRIFNSSTHFNPVDIVCSIRDYKGGKFNLRDFTDDEMAFISVKSTEGKEHKALELPGLWNGSMAGWITFFTEVPIETFSPVKTIFDLMRPEHRVG